MNSNKCELPICEVCQKPANQTCGGCKLVYYCSKAHQKLGWREGHKFKCCAFKVQYSDTYGRHMVATRNINQGEMILKEKAAVSGPRTAAPAHCLSCGMKLEPKKIGDKYDFYKCTSCNWPMCGIECEKAEVHKVECTIMTKRKYKCNIKYEQVDKNEAAYCVIAPLRVLLMKESNPRQFENIMNLESHLEERINTPLYIILKANLVTFVIQVLGLQFDEESILKVASILDTNSFDVRNKSKRLRAVYVTASMMNHSCKPNTRHIFLDDDFKLAVIATIPIAKGELITATYTQTLWGTLDRRKHLYSSKCFDCDCERCKDPTEFGTYLGNIYCSICNGPGYDYNVSNGPMMVSTDPLDESAPWKCEKCNHVLLSKQMLWGNNALKQDLLKLGKMNPKAFEDFIQTYSQTLHPSNHLIVQAKLALTQIYGCVKGYLLTEISDQLLTRKIDLCHELLDLVDKLEPGWSRIRGTLLLELQAAMAIQAKREFETNKLTKDGAHDKLTQSMDLLQEATAILKVEPDLQETLEAKMRELAFQIESTENES